MCSGWKLPSTVILCSLTFPGVIIFIFFRCLFHSFVADYRFDVSKLEPVVAKVGLSWLPV